MMGEGHSQCESGRLQYELLSSMRCGVYHGSGLFTESLDRLFPHLALLSLPSPVASACGQHAGLDSVSNRLCCWGGDSGAYQVPQISCDVVTLAVLFQGSGVAFTDASVLSLRQVQQREAVRESLCFSRIETLCW